jgi:hypothetical protein
MANKCNREGRWAAAVKEVTTQQTDGGAIMLWASVQLAHQYNPLTKAWDNCQAEDMEARGGFCLMTKTGQLMDDQISRLAKALDWDGDPDSLNSKDWNTVTVQCVTAWDDFNGGAYRVRSLYPIDSDPNPQVNLSGDLKMRMQSVARAAKTPSTATALSVAPPEIQRLHTPSTDDMPM